MFHEKGFSPLEDINSLESLPTELAQNFINGTIIEGAPLVHEAEDASHIYRCFERNEYLPEVPNARLRVDYKQHQSGSEQNDQLRFEYVLPDQRNTGSEQLVAEMHIAVQSDTQFLLEHRYVSPEYRKLGLGSRLLQETEGWLQQVADRTQQVVGLTVEANQFGIIGWLQKNGFEINEDQQIELESILQNSGEFIIENIIDTDGILKEDVIFRNDGFEESRKNVVRLIFKKQYQPRQQ